MEGNQMSSPKELDDWFNDWFNELESYSMRSERFYELVKPSELGAVLGWLKAAFEAGVIAGSKELK